MSSIREYCQTVDEDVWKQLHAFVAGAFSVCLILFFKTVLQLLQLVPLHNNSDRRVENTDHNEHDQSRIGPWNAPIHATNRFMARLSIVELPSPFKRRQHWPWETIRQRFAKSPMDSDHYESDGTAIQDPTHHSVPKISGIEKVDASSSTMDRAHHNDDTSMGSLADDDKKEPETAATSSDAAQKHKAVCIGSIFGLDVGGTLAKLVYFEQKPPDSDPLWTSFRGRHYAKAASAQAVVMARMKTEQKVGRNLPSRTCDSSCESIDSNASSAKHAQRMLRRQSFSIGLIRKTKKDQSEEKRLEQEESVDTKEHQSDQDLQRLYMMRQESLPDDVQQFRHSIDFHTLQDETCNYIFDVVDAPDDDGYIGEKESQTPASFSLSRSRSLQDMSSLIQQKAEALDRFYNFARRLADQEHAVRDSKLSFYCRELGGEFHFMRFETRRMKNAMDLIRYNNLHLNIKKMG
jgi:hypothetical protein